MGHCISLILHAEILPSNCSSNPVDLSRCSPISARIIASALPSINRFILVWTCPLTESGIISGLLLRRKDCLRPDTVPKVEPRSNLSRISDMSKDISESRVSSRLGMSLRNLVNTKSAVVPLSKYAKFSISSGISTGTSLLECTAMSIDSRTNSLSIE